MSYEVRRFGKEDLEAVMALTEGAFSGGWFPVDWEWRYTKHPSPPDLWVVEADGRVVAFASAVERPLRLAGEMIVESVAMGDFVVRPSERGKGVGSGAVYEIISRTMAMHEEAVVAVGWARQELIAGLYDSLLGLAIPRSGTLRYTRSLSWARVVNRLERLGGRAARDVSLRFDVKGMPPLTVIRGPDGIRVTDSEVDGAIPIRVALRAVGLWSGSPSRRLLKLLVAMARGDIRPKGVGALWPLLRRARTSVPVVLAVLAG